MRTVHVSGGFSGDVEVKLTDSKGQDLSPATFKIGLVPVHGEVPDANDAAWQTPATEEYPENGEAVLTMRPESSHPLGRFWPHVLVIDSGRDPELVKADDYVELT